MSCRVTGFRLATSMNHAGKPSNAFWFLSFLGRNVAVSEKHFKPLALEVCYVVIKYPLFHGFQLAVDPYLVVLAGEGLLSLASHSLPFPSRLVFAEGSGLLGLS